METAALLIDPKTANPDYKFEPVVAPPAPDFMKMVVFESEEKRLWQKRTQISTRGKRLRWAPARDPSRGPVDYAHRRRVEGLPIAGVTGLPRCGAA